MTSPRSDESPKTPHHDGLNPPLKRNIDALHRRRRREEASAGVQQRIACWVTSLTGTMAFVYVHMALVATWVAVNLGAVPGLQPFDKTFVILSTTASVEAIFLSTFVLISQNRASAAADRRADLDLQINLLTEHEVTRLISLTSAIADRLGVEHEAAVELAELARDVAPERVLDTLETKHGSR